MARTLHKLSDLIARSPNLKPGRHSDGGGLYLNVAPGGTKSWIFLYSRGGKRRARGLGAYPEVKLALARKRAEKLRSELAETGSIPEKQSSSVEPTFAECVDQFLVSMEGQWRNSKHRAQWRMTLGEAYCRHLLHRHVSAISTDDVLAVLNPVWAKKPETASRLRGRIERVLDFAKVRGWRGGENPALWRGHLKNVLPPRQRLSRGHHAAMPYGELPEFMARLKTSEATAARALEFAILTAARSGETLGARWEEIDFPRLVWILPAERMKAGRQHRVPLSDGALGVIERMWDMRTSEFIFPGQKAGHPLSSMSMEMLLRRMKVNSATVHGFRSSFRDWVAEETDFPSEVAEAALAHVSGDATERAYRRGDVLMKRRQLMKAWSDFLGVI